MKNALLLRDFSKKKEDQIVKLAACLKQVEISVEELEFYSEISGVQDAIQTLTSLRQTLADQLAPHL